MVFEGKPEVSRVGRIVEAEAARGARRHRQHGILLTVHQEVGALTAIHQVDHIVRRDGTRSAEPKICDEGHDVVDVSWQRITLRIDDECAGQAAVHLLGREPVRMRVVPVGARAVGGQDKFVDAPATTGDRAHGISILCGGDRHAVPVDGRFLTGDLVLEQDAHLVACGRFDERARNHAIVGPELGLLASADVQASGNSSEPGFEDPGGLAFVHELRQGA